MHFPCFSFADVLSYFVIMLSRSAYKKQAERILGNINHQPLFTSPLLSNLPHKLNTFIQSSFSFGINSQMQEDVLQCLLGSGLCHKEIIDLWNSSLHHQLSKVRKTLKKLQTTSSISWQKLIQDAGIKIERCCVAIEEILNRICQKMNWCKCERNSCGIKIRWQILASRLKQFCFSKQVVQQQNKKQEFISCQEDEECERITLNKLNGGVNEEQMVIKFLTNLKIEGKRKYCEYSSGWLEDLRKKYSNS